MAISKRAFLRGAGVVVATGATGGASALAGAVGGVVTQGAAAVAASGAGLASGLSALERKANAAMALARHGGFPILEIRDLLSSERLIDKFTVHKRVGILLGGDEPARVTQGSRKGKVDFFWECNCLRIIQHLPRGVPLKDVLSLEMYRDTVKNNGLAHKGVHSSSAGKYLNEENVQAFLDILGPYCDENTTVEDLEKIGLDYFARVARQFLEKPRDFTDDFFQAEYIAYDLKGALSYRRGETEEDSPHRDLLAALEERQKKYHKANELLDQRRRRQYEKHSEERWKQVLQKRTAREEAQRQEAECRKISPSARERFDARLFRGEKGEYQVDERVASRVLKADWLHFMQEIIPESAKPGDIELRCGGLMVAFHNAEIVQYLDDLAREKGARQITVSLPNRRMGFDLNEPEPPQMGGV